MKWTRKFCIDNNCRAQVYSLSIIYCIHRSNGFVSWKGKHCTHTRIYLAMLESWDDFNVVVSCSRFFIICLVFTYFTINIYPQVLQLATFSMWMKISIILARIYFPFLSCFPLHTFRFFFCLLIFIFFSFQIHWLYIFENYNKSSDAFDALRNKNTKGKNS